jgi:cytochrome c-type biogenesis protein CcmH/NrfG
MAWVYFETRHYKDAIDEWRQMALLQHDIARVKLGTEAWIF